MIYACFFKFNHFFYHFLYQKRQNPITALDEEIEKRYLTQDQRLPVTHVYLKGPSGAYMRLWSRHHWFKQWLVVWPVPSHLLNQCGNIFNWTLRNKFQWKLYRNWCIFSQEYAFNSVLWKMATILFRPQCVKFHHTNKFTSYGSKGIN